MDSKGSTFARVVGLLGTVVFVLSLLGCKHDVPITSAPTRPVDARLLGVWVTDDGKETMRVGKWDDSQYAVCYEGEVYRAFHSDVGQAMFVTVQDLNSGDRKYTYMKYRLGDDERRLTVWMVRDEVVPEGSSDSARVRELLEKNATNPDLLGDAVPYTKK